MSSSMVDLHVDQGACQRNIAEVLELMALLTEEKLTSQLLYPPSCITGAKREP